MKRLSINFIVTLFFILLLQGCGGVIHRPDQFAKSVDVFSSNQITSDTPEDSKMSMTYEASYEDVFRLAKVSASQAQFLIEKSDKENGYINASQSTRRGVHIATLTPSEQVGGRTGGTVVSEKRFYLIKIKELTGESTEVTIVNKVQFECIYDDKFLVDPKPCEQMSKVHWPVGPQIDITNLENFHKFLNNNLISAGLI